MDCTRCLRLLFILVTVACGISLVACQDTTTEPQVVTPCNQMCTFIYKPVCGTDGKTYSNECVLRSLTCLKQLQTTEPINCQENHPSHQQKNHCHRKPNQDVYVNLDVRV